MTVEKPILIINGSLRGDEGNSGAIARKAASYLKETYGRETKVLTLASSKPSIREVYELLVDSEGFLAITGNYWNNWGSPLQRFIEVSTAFENSPAFFGKPFTCAISMDSVGGAEIAARLHSAFSGLGCWSPPCSTLVLSRVGQEAIQNTMGQPDDPNEDVWRLDDLQIVLDNLVIASGLPQSWKAWPHVELSLQDGPWPDTGILNFSTPRFL